MIVRTHTIGRPAMPYRPMRRALVIRAGAYETIREISQSPVIYYTGHVITAFTMFYCGLNWLMYKSINQKNKN